MPYKTEYKDDLGGVITTYWGVVTDEDLHRSGYEKYSNLEKLKSFLYALTDLSKVDKFKVSSDGIRENARISSEILDINKKMIVVFVLPTKFQYGMGRMWQAYAGDNGDRSHIFESRIEADKWIDEKLNGQF